MAGDVPSPPDGPQHVPPVHAAGRRSAVSLWLAGLAGYALLLLLLAVVRRLVEDDSVQRLATVAVSSLTWAGLGALVWRTWHLRRGPGVTVTQGATPVLVAPDLAWPREALRRARRRGLRGRLRRALPAVALVLLVPAVVAGERAVARDAALLSTQPVRQAVVVEVRRPVSPAGEPDVVVGVDGREVTLALGYPGAHDAETGQVLDVVVDPADPARVLATTSHDDWAYTWWGSVLTWGLIAGVWLVLLTRRLPRLAAVRAARTVVTHRPARVVSTGPDWVVLDDGCDRWVFEGQHPAGPYVVLLGDPAPSAWVVLDDGRTRLPRGPLRSVGVVEVDDDGWDDDGWDDDDEHDDEPCRGGGGRGADPGVWETRRRRRLGRRHGRAG